MVSPVSLSMLVRAEEASARRSRVMGRRPGGRSAEEEEDHRPTRTAASIGSCSAPPRPPTPSTDAPGTDRPVCCQRARLHRGAMCAFRSVPPDRGLELSVVAD